VSSPVSSPVKD
jgi:hypothetical protein